jgi:hypothetical protein
MGSDKPAMLTSKKLPVIEPTVAVGVDENEGTMTEEDVLKASS